MTMQMLDVSQGKLAYRTTGTGERTIVWVHGLPLDSTSWKHQEEHFTPIARNVFLDLRGYGRSSKLPPATTDVTQLYADDLHALLQHLDLHNIVLVGFASAGHVALRYAAQHPDRLGDLITLNGSPRFRRGDDWPWGFGDAGIRHFTEAARERGIDGITDAVLDPDTVFRDVDADEAARLADWFRPMSHNAGTDTLLGFFNTISHDDDRHLLTHITARTLVISSTAGKEVPSDVGLYLRQHIADARLVEIPGADHFVFATRPHLVNLLIGQVL